LIGHWYWEQSLSSLYTAIYTDWLPASLCWVMSRSSIISTLASTIHHSCCSCLWGLHFHPVRNRIWPQSQPTEPASKAAYNW
jgi:hypothetical protein